MQCLLPVVIDVIIKYLHVCLQWYSCCSHVTTSSNSVWHTCMYAVYVKEGPRYAGRVCSGKRI